MTDYQEHHRPQLHYSPPAHWANDPNGMVYLDGRYHLFYQHHPHSSVWGPMHWGHAVSTDLVHWKQCPIALAPDELGFIWSGSAVHDRDNTSGLGEPDNGPLVCIYTYHCDELERAGNNDHEYQGLAYSNDDGDSWHKYAGNPVLPNDRRVRDFRDPKVFWHDATDEWIMVLSAGYETQFWASNNLLEWNYRSSFGATSGAHGGVWECPDLVRVRVAGSDERRWVLIQSLNPGGPQGGSGTQYFVGDFDGTTFSMCEVFAESRPEGTGVWIDHGPDCYAGVTWANVPADDGRVLFLGWLNNWEYAHVTPTQPWRGAMTLVRELELSTDQRGARLRSVPVVELNTLRRTRQVLFDGALPANHRENLVSNAALVPGDIEIGFTCPATGCVEFYLRNTLSEFFCIGFDADKQAFFADRSESGETAFCARQFPQRHWVAVEHAIAPGSPLDMRIVADSSSLEVFFNRSEIAYTALAFPTELYTSLEVSTSQESIETRIVHHAMQSIWS